MTITFACFLILGCTFKIISNLQVSTIGLYKDYTRLMRRKFFTGVFKTPLNGIEDRQIWMTLFFPLIYAFTIQSRNDK